MAATGLERADRDSSSGNSSNPVVATPDCSFTAPRDDHLTKEGEDASGIKINFSGRLTPRVRKEKVKQLSKNHEAIVQSRQINETLVQIQQSLRKMPGIPAGESDSIIEKLKHIGQTISHELSQLVDAVLYLRLDADENRNNMSRLTLQSTLRQTDIDFLKFRVSCLQDSLETSNANLQEQKRLSGVEAQGKKKVIAKLTELNKQWHDRQGQSSVGTTEAAYDSVPSWDLIKCLQDTFKHLEDREKKLHSRQVMALAAPPYTTSTESFTHGSSKAANTLEDQTLEEKRGASHFMSESDASTGFQPQSSIGPVQDLQSLNRPATAGPSANFQRNQAQFPGMFQISNHGPPIFSARPPSRFAHWGANAGQGYPSRPPSSNNNGFYTSTVARAQARKLLPTQVNPYHHQRAPSNSLSSVLDLIPIRRTPAPGFDRKDFSRPPTRAMSYDSGPVEVDSQPGDFPSAQGAEFHQAMVKSSTHKTGAVITITPRTLDAWRRQIHGMYDIIRHFVNLMACDPDPQASCRLVDTPLWESLKRCYQPLGKLEASAYVDVHMKDPVAKPCLVTRVLVDFVVNLVWNPMAWKGFDEESTVALLDIKMNLDGPKVCQPGFQKQPYLDELANVIDSIQKHPNSGPFHSHKIEQLSYALNTHVRPLLNHDASEIEVRQMLHPVADMAWNLSSKILTSRLTFDFRFPDVGGRFSQQSMVPIWPDADPMQLQAKHWRVALVTTPVVTCRNDTGNSISAHSVSSADVYCMH